MQIYLESSRVIRRIVCHRQKRKLCVKMSITSLETRLEPGTTDRCRDLCANSRGDLWEYSENAFTTTFMVSLTYGNTWKSSRDHRKFSQTEIGTKIASKIYSLPAPTARSPDAGHTGQTQLVDSLCGNKFDQQVNKWRVTSDNKW